MVNSINAEYYADDAPNWERQKKSQNAINELALICYH